MCFKKHANSTNHPLCFVGALFVKSCRCLPTSSQLSTTSCLAFSCLVHVFAVLAIVYFIMQSLWIMHAFVHVSVGGNLCVCIVGEVAEAILLCAWAVLLAYPSSFIPISLWLSKLDPPPCVRRSWDMSMSTPYDQAFGITKFVDYLSGLLNPSNQVFRNAQSVFKLILKTILRVTIWHRVLKMHQDLLSSYFLKIKWNIITLGRTLS